jgi:hypothetical protein
LVKREEICLTGKERKELLKKKESWQAFSNLLSRAMSDLNRTTKFDETCEVLENFVSLGKQLFKNQDERICSIINKMEKFLDEAQRKMYELDQKAKPLIQDTVDLYNAKYQGDLSFDGDVDQWFNRTFPLVVLYINKKIKEGGNDGSISNS